MFEQLSSASLTLARAPSLLQAPQPRAALPVGVRYPEPPVEKPRRAVRQGAVRRSAALEPNGAAAP